MPPLDPTTLLFSLSILSLLMGTIAFSAARSAPQDRLGLQDWACAMVSGSLAYALFFLRGHWPTLLTFVLANVATLACAGFGVRAHARLLGTRASTPWLLAVIAAGLVGVLLFHLGLAHRGIAVLTVSGSLCLLVGQMALMLAWRRRCTRPAGMVALLVALPSAAAMSAVFGARALAGVQASPIVMPDSGSSLQVGTLMVGAVYIVASSIGFFFMAHDGQRQAAVARAQRDALTGLLNRTAFREQAEALARRETQPLTVLMFDLDHFKSINDAFGHGGGDQVLAEVGALVRRLLRQTDLAGRYGGEEFCLLLPGCSEAEAADVAARLVEGAAALAVPLRDGRVCRFTLSVGHACAPGPCRALDELIERADQALYAAKHSGRNRAVGALALQAQPVPADGALQVRQA